MSVEMGKPTVTIESNVDQTKIGEDLTLTTITGFIDVEKIITIGDRVIILEKKLPYSYATITGMESGCRG